MNNKASRHSVSDRFIVMLSHLVGRLETMSDPDCTQVEAFLQVIEFEVRHELERLCDLPASPTPILDPPASPPEDLPF